MAVKVMIPTPLRAYTDKLEAIELEGNTVAELLSNLAERYEPLKKHLFNDEGKLRKLRQRLRQRRGHPIPFAGRNSA